MNSFESGQLIAQLRKEAGYTQKSLAEKLFITDKAVSKWERGVCKPDASLLTKLSMILDADIEYLLAGETPYGKEQWVGELRIDDIEGSIAGKPLLHYLLSYFMLVGIKDIAIITNDRKKTEKYNLSSYGLNISYMPFGRKNTMYVYSKFLLFGANITRHMKCCMASKNSSTMMLHGQHIPIVFSHRTIMNNIEDVYCKYEAKELGRGTIYIPLNTETDIRNASEFVRIYEKYHITKIADLNEIGTLRGLM